MHDPTCKGKWTPALRNYIVLTNRKRVGEGEIRLPNFLCFYSVWRKKKGRRIIVGEGGLNIMLVTGSKEHKTLLVISFFDAGDANFFCLRSFSDLSVCLSTYRS